MSGRVKRASRKNEGRVEPKDGPESRRTGQEDFEKNGEHMGSFIAGCSYDPVARDTSNTVGCEGISLSAPEDGIKVLKRRHGVVRESKSNGRALQSILPHVALIE